MEQLIETAITAVTLYPDRARIVRMGSPDSAMTPQTTQLVIDNLPLTIDRQSIRISGEGTAAVRIMGMALRAQHMRDSPAEDVRALTEKIEQVAAEISQTGDEISSLQKQINYLAGLRTETKQFAKGLASGQTKPSDQIELLTFLADQDKTTAQRLRDIVVARNELNKTDTQLKKQLQQINSQRATRRLQAVIDVEVSDAGDFAPELTYVVKNASWKPLYDIRLSGTRLDVTMLAQITQQTGENWSQVALTVSTARPALNQRLPELNPWFIDKRSDPPPRPEPRMEMMAGQAHSLSNGEIRTERTMAKRRKVADVAIAEVETTDVAVTFRIPKRVDVASDGSTRKVTIGRYEITPTLDYMSAPCHTDAVYRRLKFANTTPAPLLKGASNLFVDDEFIGSNQMKYTARGDEVELLLGVEDRITVTRELGRRQVDKRFMRDKRVVRYGYTIELHNHLAAEATVTVQDQFPVSRHDEIIAKLDQAEPQPTELSDMHILEWKLRLNPDQERTISYTYIVEHPRTWDVVGLKD